MKEKYFRVKGRNSDSIVFVKSGNFWNAFYGDAVIVHYITNYKICNNKLGFPNKVLNKVLGKISSLNINYILVYELDDLKCYEYSSNSYTFYFHKYMDLYKLERGMQKYIMSKV